MMRFACDQCGKHFVNKTTLTPGKVYRHRCRCGSVIEVEGPPANELVAPLVEAPASTTEPVIDLADILLPEPAATPLELLDPLRITAAELFDDLAVAPAARPPEPSAPPPRAPATNSVRSPGVSLRPERGHRALAWAVRAAAAGLLALASFALGRWSGLEAGLAGAATTTVGAVATPAAPFPMAPDCRPDPGR